jgi:septal ring-binding cell division protein DamX
MKTTVAAGVAALLFAAANPSQGAETLGSSLDRLVGCADIAESSARLECFDRGVAPLRPQRVPPPGVTAPVVAPALVAAPAPVAAVPPPVAQSAPVSSQAPVPAQAAPSAPPTQFALGEEQLKGRNQVQAAQEQASLQARITQAGRGGQGTYLITLDNGQVWRHDQGSMASYLTPGEAVTITRASMGSYRLTLDSGSKKNWVRVTRVR